MSVQPAMCRGDRLLDEKLKIFKTDSNEYAGGHNGLYYMDMVHKGFCKLFDVNVTEHSDCDHTSASRFPLFPTLTNAQARTHVQPDGNFTVQEN